MLLSSVSCRLACLVLLAVSQPVFAEMPLLKQPGRWVQDYTDRSADLAVRFGTLPNGLRYAIMHNEMPQDGVSMRMRIGSGSMAEHDDEQGLAHFLEHMAFRGSANMADGDIVRLLQRQGLTFGADTNAMTSQSETVYQFNFPHVDDTTLHTGLSLFREISDRLTLTPAAVDAERGVILSEERLRDTLSYQSYKASLKYALSGTRYLARWPIGQVDTIKTATAAQLRRFYQANYRPDNTTLIVVGNINVNQVEQDIKSLYADWKSDAVAAPLGFAIPNPEVKASQFVVGGAPDEISLSWVRQADPRAATEAVVREYMLEQIGLNIVKNRLNDQSAWPNSPYLSGYATFTPNLSRAAALTQIGVIAPPAHWQAALDALVTTQRQVVEGGITDEDLKRAKNQFRAIYQTAAGLMTTRKSNDIANQMVEAVDQDQLITSPMQDLYLAERVYKSTRIIDVMAALKIAFIGEGPVLFRSAQRDAVPVTQLEQQLAEDYSKPLTAYQAEAIIKWPYSSFGNASEVVSRTKDEALDATIVQFANGTRLIVKSTGFDKGSVYVNVRFGYGRTGADPDLAHALWAVNMMPLGGTGKLSMDQIERWAQTKNKVFNISLHADDTAFRMSGAAASVDLEQKLQLFAAFARDPGYRPILASKLDADKAMFRGQLDASPSTVYSREAQRLTFGNDARYVEIPDASAIAQTQATDLPLLLNKALAGPADVTVVGEISVGRAIAAVQDTFGAGDIQSLAPVPAIHLGLPVGRAEPYVVMHGGRADQAVYGEYWALPDYFADPHLNHVANVAAAILQTRLQETAREQFGMTYAPRSTALSSADLPGRGYLNVMLETPPANFDAFRHLLDQEILNLTTTPVSADELVRAKVPMVAAQGKAMETNAYWDAMLPRVLRDPRAKSLIVDAQSGLQSVTAADVQALFAHYIHDQMPVTIIAEAKHAP